MPDNKPIKRNKHIVELSKDHHLTLLFCWKIRKGINAAVDPERMKKYVHYFWQQHMQPHFTEEETILFAPLKDAAVQRALEEHAAIAQQIKDLNVLGNTAYQQLSTLADSVDKHVRYEERELFPHLEKVLTDEQLETIGKQLAVHHAPTIKDDFADAFWLQEKNKA